MMSRQQPTWRKEYTVLLASICCTSLWHVVGKFALSTAHPNEVVFVFYRLLFAAILLVSVAMYTKPFNHSTPVSSIRQMKSMKSEDDPSVVGRTREEGANISPARSSLQRQSVLGSCYEFFKAAWKWFLFLGFCKAANNLCFIKALSLSSPAVCAIMQPTVPVFVTIIAWFKGDMGTWNYRRIIGLALSAFGAAGGAAAAHERSKLSDDPEEKSLSLAFICLIAQALALAFLLTYQARVLELFPSAPPLLVTGFIYTCACVLVLPLVVFQPLNDLLLTSSSSAWLALGYCVVFATAFSYGSIAWVTKRGVSASTISIFITLEPFMSASLAAVFLGLVPHNVPLFVACALMVSFGVILTLSDPERKEVVGSGFQQLRHSKSGEYDDEAVNTL